MRMVDVQGIEITAPRRKVFEFLREPANLPRWAHAFVSVGNGHARLEDAPSERRILVEHALRSAVKRVDADALRLLGHGKTPRVSVEAVAFIPRRVRIGGRVNGRAIRVGSFDVSKA